MANSLTVLQQERRALERKMSEMEEEMKVWRFLFFLLSGSFPNARQVLLPLQISLPASCLRRGENMGKSERLPRAWPSLSVHTYPLYLQALPGTKAVWFRDKTFEFTLKWNLFVFSALASPSRDSKKSLTQVPQLRALSRALEKPVLARVSTWSAPSPTPPFTGRNS